MLNQGTPKLRAVSLLAIGLLLATAVVGSQAGARVQGDGETKTLSLDIEGMT